MSEIVCSMSPAQVERPSPADLPAFVPYACIQLRAIFSVIIQSEVQEEYTSKLDDKNKKGKKSVAVLQQKSTSRDESILETNAMVAYTEPESNEIKMTAIVNNAEQLVQLMLKRCIDTPRLLLQVIGLCVPFCPHLTSLTLQFCRLSGTVLYEIAKFLPHSQITEVCLDDSTITDTERTYYMLLDTPTKLRSLSLARCNISNYDCALLFEKLEYPLPASKTLMTLNLTSNFISNSGARSIAKCLRSNRTLQYLNLAGNHISDDGCMEILSSLMEFPLTVDEILKKKKRFIDFLNMRLEVYNKFLKEVTAMVTDKNADELSRTGKRKTPRLRESVQMKSFSSRDVMAAKAEMLTEEFVGNYSDPFSAEETVFKDKYLYSTGNMSLCCLNFAYNNLGFMSVKKFIDVLRYQSLVKSSEVGLLYVQLQGNNLPLCVETAVLYDWLEQAVYSRLARTQPRKDRAKSKK